MSRSHRLFMVIPPPVLTAVGAGLMWTVTTATPNSRIIGFQSELYDV